MENAHQGLILQRPKPDSIVLRGRNKALIVDLNTNSIDWTGMTDENEALFLNSSLLIFLSFF
jgi:hypothetical protein